VYHEYYVILYLSTPICRRLYALEYTHGRQRLQGTRLGGGPVTSSMRLVAKRSPMQLRLVW